MPIAALSEDTVCAITSSLVLNKATSAVKELIDNALDSNATNISVEISSNTLDVIQVKDNGTGIGLEDRQVICKRCYTSKIRSLEDLAGLGGSSLGFRGEALASIAELSESLTITTRVEGELAGTLLKFDARGKLVSSSSASHGSGTTVKVHQFLRAVPVRQQAALKIASKILTNIKQLLFTYAVARPTTRLQLKILKSKSDFKGNWSYIASQDDTDLGLTASKVVGKDIAKACRQESIVSEDGCYKINALMVANVQSKANFNDQFISIDGRPLNTEGSLMKTFSKIYRSYLKNQVADQDILPRRLFLVVCLFCPRGSYDVNIEPAKDEVMFENVQIVTDLFEELCKQVYGHLPAPNAITRTIGREQTWKQRPFNLLMAKRPDTNSMTVNGSSLGATGVGENLATSPSHSVSAASTPSANTFYRSSSELDDEQIDRPKIVNSAEQKVENVCADPTDSAEEHDLMQPQITNPFVLAKLNSRISRNAQSETHAHRHSNGEAKTSDCDTPGETESVDNSMPNTMPDWQTAGPSISHYDQCTRKSLSVSKTSEQVISRSPDKVNRSATSPVHTADLCPPKVAMKPTLVPMLTTSAASDLMDVRRSEPIDITFSRSSRSPSSSVISPRRTGILQQPFRVPFKTPASAAKSAENGPNTSYPTPLSGFKKVGSAPSSSRSPSHPPPVSESASELKDIMEFENRKRDHIMQHKLKYQSRKIDRKRQESPSDDELPNCYIKDSDVPSIISSKALYEARFRSKAQAPTITRDNIQFHVATHTPEAEGKSSPILAATSSPFSSATEANPTGDVTISEKDKIERMHLSDPRAILIRLQARNSVDTQVPKYNKLNIAKLPFESISHETATYTARAFMNEEMDFDLSILNKQHRALHIYDQLYARSGAIRLILTDSREDKENLELCKATAVRMVQERHR